MNLKIIANWKNLTEIPPKDNNRSFCSVPCWMLINGILLKARLHENGNIYEIGDEKNMWLVKTSGFGVEESAGRKVMIIDPSLIKWAAISECAYNFDL